MIHFKIVLLILILLPFRERPLTFFALIVCLNIRPEATGNSLNDIIGEIRPVVDALLNRSGMCFLCG